MVIPVKLRDTVIRILHSTHIGMSGMKSLARSYVYWPQHTNKDVMGELFTVIDKTPGINAAETTVELSKYRNFEGTTSLTLATRLLMPRENSGRQIGGYHSAAICRIYKNSLRLL